MLSYHHCYWWRYTELDTVISLLRKLVLSNFYCFIFFFNTFSLHYIWAGRGLIKTATVTYFSPFFLQGSVTPSPLKLISFLLEWVLDVTENKVEGVGRCSEVLLSERFLKVVCSMQLCSDLCISSRLYSNTHSWCHNNKKAGDDETRTEFD